MKLKKVFSVLLASALMMSLAPSAFALTGEGDTREEAIYLNSGDGYGSYLNPQDVDWFRISNNDSIPRVLTVKLENDAPINYDVEAYYTRSDGTEAHIEAIDQGYGQTDMCAFWVQPGTTAYIKVKGHNGTFGWPGLDTTYRLFVNF